MWVDGKRMVKRDVGVVSGWQGQRERLGYIRNVRNDMRGPIQQCKS